MAPWQKVVLRRSLNDMQNMCLAGLLHRAIMFLRIRPCKALCRGLRLLRPIRLAKGSPCIWTQLNRGRRTRCFLLMATVWLLPLSRVKASTVVGAIGAVVPTWPYILNVIPGMVSCGCRPLLVLLARPSVLCSDSGLLKCSAVWLSWCDRDWVNPQSYPTSLGVPALFTLLVETVSILRRRLQMTEAGMTCILPLGLLVNVLMMQSRTLQCGGCSPLAWACLFLTHYLRPRPPSTRRVKQAPRIVWHKRLLWNLWWTNMTLPWWLTLDTGYRVRPVLFRAPPGGKLRPLSV